MLFGFLTLSTSTFANVAWDRLGCNDLIEEGSLNHEDSIRIRACAQICVDEGCTWQEQCSEIDTAIDACDSVSFDCVCPD